MAYPDVILAETSLVSYWRLGEASGTFDDSKGTNDSIAVGAGTTYGVASLLPSESNTAVDLNGTTGWIRVGDSASLDITGAVSIEAWIRINGVGADGIPQAVLAKYTAAQSGDYELYIVSNGSGVGSDISLDIRGGGSTSELSTWPLGELLTLGEVYHIVGTYQDSTNTMKIYVNGVEIASKTDATVVLAASVSDLNIGGRKGDGGVGDPNGLFFNGALDEVAVYNAALSPTAVLDHYNAGIQTATASDDPPIGILGRGAGW